jgi:hypothetical protein
LEHYFQDRNDPSSISEPWLELRVWRIANLVQILQKVLLAIEPICNSDSEYYAKLIARYDQFTIPSGWGSFLNDSKMTLSNSEAAELAARHIILSSSVDLNSIYTDIKVAIKESTWDL